MAHLDMTGYRLAPQELSTAQAVMENAARVMAFRRKMRAPAPKPVAPPVVEKPKEPVILIGGMEIAGSVIGRLQGTPVGPVSHYLVADIQSAICAVTGVTRNEMLAHRQFKKLVEPRQIAMMLAAHLTKLSLPQIGREFDRDHSTICHAKTKMAAVLEDIKPRVQFGAPVHEWAIVAVESHRRIQS